ncbi:MAG TPA: N-acyl homoserine lactonase family protein [Acidimicrobiales bacterium]|jgi:glyoxylase-like metal-dependent hydrolase (beta-lactamase superfamily II)|nr:N-acyl homoserine lactonase family protein [Acidimicrobiales bacterium]
MDTSGLMEGASGRTRVPIPSYLIEHAGSVVVFDAGLHPDFANPESDRSKGVFAGFECLLPEGSALDARLASCGIDPTDVNYLVLSHMHFDHIGGSVLLGDVDMVVQRSEWLAAVADLKGEIYMPADVNPDRPRKLIDGEWDIFNDGRVVVTPTTGHTPGHQSLRILTDDGETLVLCGDSCYLRASLETSALPPRPFDGTAQLSVFSWLRELETEGARIVFGHEPSQWPTGLEDDGVVELA